MEKIDLLLVEVPDYRFTCPSRDPVVLASRFAMLTRPPNIFLYYNSVVEAVMCSSEAEICVLCCVKKTEETLPWKPLNNFSKLFEMFHVHIC